MMDAGAGFSTVGGGGVSPGGGLPPPSFISKKCKKIIVIAASALAATVGVAAAVIFFAVSSIALSPAIAITAMSVGAIGLGVLLIYVGYKCYKAYNRHMNSSKLPDSSQSTFSPSSTPPIPASTPLKEFGPEAFKIKKFELPQRTPMNDGAFQSVIQNYKDSFKGASATVGGPVTELLSAAYNKGILQGTAQETFKTERNKIQARMRIIFEWLIVPPGSQPTPRQNEVASNLGIAFEGCQVVKYDAIAKAADEVLTMIGDTSGGEESIVPALFAAWQKYKMQILDTIIIKRHPNSNQLAQEISKQLVHIKSAYIAKFGDILGFPGVETARLDNHRPPDLADSASFPKAFMEALNLEDFANFIVLDINNPKQDESLFQKETFGKFVRERAGLPPLGFCYYDETKNYKIQTIEKGISKEIQMKFNNEQEFSMQPFVTIEEIRILLRYFQVGIAA